MNKFLLVIFFLFYSFYIFGQDCTILSKSNGIIPDRLCSPVTVEWTVSYTGVNANGTLVQIRYEWDDGIIETINAKELSSGVFQSVNNHTYTSEGNKCNYHPRATLIVNGELCTSSSQEQIVTVWDNDNHNGGIMNINPALYPICFGNSANVQFQDVTRFNCVPPQERDNPNVNTRWVQWLYGTDNTMTGSPVMVDGVLRTFPYSSPVITLPGPVTGSGILSDVINVADDKQIGEYWEITLRNWNYCNPYDDPKIPGPPLDLINGDNEPVVTTAIIIIVDYPDATITPVNALCESDPSVILSAVDGGGVWSGPGISGNTFNPSLAGPGVHEISYRVIDGNGCSDEDKETITVIPSPNATILTSGSYCLIDSSFKLEAVDEGGNWSGNGVIGDMFEPILAGKGDHLISYYIEDEFGCFDEDTTVISVIIPKAKITPVDTLCIDETPVTLEGYDLGGIWFGDGVIEDTFYPSISGVGDHLVTYTVNKGICSDKDSIIITVMPLPVIEIEKIDTLFINSFPVELNVIPNNGFWYGPGVSDTIFDPSEVGVGEYYLFYQTYPYSWGCSVLDSIKVVVTKPKLPIAFFDGHSNGCSPLTIYLNNKSIRADTYIWDFGDGTFSNEESPSHTYYVPEEYIIRLTAINITGSSYYEVIISVYQNPIVQFNIFPTEIINNNQIIKTINFSQYGNSYLWEFGDGNKSTDFEPTHKYENPGSYSVSLIVTTNDGCIDSALFNTEINVDFKSGEINFPNAFKWNGAGPTGGYWNENEIDNDVFRPHPKNVVEYNLLIYTRWGELIYESNDLYKGWDGYIDDNNLAPQGVYVYKVTGRYANGEYFTKVGDVTFLH